MLNAFATNTMKLKSLSIEVDDRKIEFDDLITFECTHNLFTFGIYGVVVFRDTYDIFNAKKVKITGQTKVKLVFADTFGKWYFKSFSVIDVENNEDGRVKTVTLKLLDDFTYKLRTTYSNSLKTSRFNSDIVSVFKNVISQLGLNTLLNKEKIKTDFVSCDDRYSMIIPNGIALYDWFLQEFRKSNIRLWFDNFNLHCKELKITDLKINNKEIKDKNGGDIQVTYTNDNQNYDCVYHIREFEKQFGNKIVPFPKIAVNRVVDKSHYTETINLDTFCKEIILNKNDDFSQIQESSAMSVTHLSDTLKAQKYDLFENYIQQNKMIIVVAGNLRDLNAGSITNTYFKNTTSQFRELQLSGDVTSSGVYLIIEVTHKIVGDKFIDRAVLSRFDNPKSRKL